MPRATIAAPAFRSGGRSQSGEIREYAPPCAAYALAMGVLTNRRLEVFAQLLAVGKTVYDAAREAGYNANAASFESNARQRYSKPEVKARVAELQQRTADRVADRISIDRAWILAQLQEIAGYDLTGTEINTAHKLKALELVAKVVGAFAPEKREIIARLAELDLDQLKALDARLAEAEDEQPDLEDMN
jgi:hypothetical protein